MRVTEREPRYPTGTSISGAPSVATVVTSIDKEFAQYPVNFRVQNPCVEIVQEIKPMIRERLEMCKAEDGKVYPDNLLTYRDRVLEGQYVQVKDQELAQIDEEIEDIHPLPRVSYIVVGKRYNTLTFPTNPAQADKNGNTRTGTIVDRGIAMKRECDFYLQPHTVFQGTVKSVHIFSSSTT